MTSREVIELALNFVVHKKPLYYKHGEDRLEFPRQYALVRNDTGAPLEIVGEVYKVVQNQDAVDFMDSVLSEFGATYDTAGSLHGGKKIWVTVNLPRQRFAVNGKDEVNAYATFLNPHGYGSGDIFAHANRVVCANTARVELAKNRDKALHFRHTGDVKAKVADARLALGLAVQGIDRFKETAEAMASTKCEVKHYANDVLDAVLEKSPQPTP
jgi:phage/plasmid-like protein (TIGR03299 family)